MDEEILRRVLVEMLNPIRDEVDGLSNKVDELSSKLNGLVIDNPNINGYVGFYLSFEGSTVPLTKEQETELINICKNAGKAEEIVEYFEKVSPEQLEVDLDKAGYPIYKNVKSCRLAPVR